MQQKHKTDKAFGCSKCRYSPSGCARCRNPTFKSRAVAPISQLRQVTTESAQQQRKQRIQLRRDFSLQTSTTAREQLVHRLRKYLNEDGDDDGGGSEHAIDITTTTANSNKRHLQKIDNPQKPTHQHVQEQRQAAKYRKIVDTAPPSDIQTTRTTSDEEMMDVDEGKEKEKPASNNNSPSTKKRDFLELLSDTMAQNREFRTSPSPILASNRQQSKSPASKRQKRGKLLSPVKRRIPRGDGAIDDGEEPKINPRISTWVPPVSPYGLLEEEPVLYSDPWKLLVCCMLLNKTHANQVRKVMWDLFALIPSPGAAVAAETSAVEEIIQPLGLFRKRAAALQRMSDEYLKKDWHDPRELHSVGQYGSDAYWIFCRGKWRDVEPQDKDLIRYKMWLASNDGLGTGLMRGA